MRPMKSTPWDRLRALHVRNGDGVPFGTFRMRSALVVAWVMVALGLTLPPWLLVDFVRLNARFGLPWNDGVVDEVISSGLMSAIVCAGAWFGLLRPRLEVFSSGVRAVRYFDSLSVAWADIERFDCTQQLD